MCHVMKLDYSVKLMLVVYGFFLIYATFSCFVIFDTCGFFFPVFPSCSVTFCLFFCLPDVIIFLSLLCNILQSRSLYVKNLSFKTSDESLKKHFSEQVKEGKIFSVKVIIQLARIITFIYLIYFFFSISPISMCR